MQRCLFILFAVILNWFSPTDAHALNRLTNASSPSVVITYDADGNLLSDGRWTYAWDGENL